LSWTPHGSSVRRSCPWLRLGASGYHPDSVSPNRDAETLRRPGCPAKPSSCEIERAPAATRARQSRRSVRTRGRRRSNDRVLPRLTGSPDRPKGLAETRSLLARHGEGGAATLPPPGGVAPVWDRAAIPDRAEA
jgi:hypothetical protein